MQRVCNLRVNFFGRDLRKPFAEGLQRTSPMRSPHSAGNAGAAPPLGTGTLKERSQLDFIVVYIIDTGFVDIAYHAVAEAERADAEHRSES